MRTQADSLHRQLSELHSLREAVLSELATMKSELFSSNAITQLTRSVRDREVQLVRKVSQKVGVRGEFYQFSSDGGGRSNAITQLARSVGDREVQLVRKVSW